MFDFPNSPTLNQVYTDVTSGASYRWNGTVWNGESSDANWTMKRAQLAKQSNVIYNGGFQVAQLSSFAVVSANGAYFADGWVHSAAPLNGTSQVIYPNTAPLQRSPSTRAQMKCTTLKASLAASDIWVIYHPIEGVDLGAAKWGTTNGLPLLLRFGFKGPAGTYGVGFHNPAVTSVYNGSFTVTAGNANVDKIYFMQIPAPPNGTTWPSGGSWGATLRFGLASGTTYTGALGWGTANLLGPVGMFNGFNSTSNVFELFDVNLVIDFDNLNIDPGFTPAAYHDEVLRCLRYFQRMGVYASISAYQAGGSTIQMPVSWPPMRQLPNVTITNTGSYSNASGMTLQPNTAFCGICYITTTATGASAAYNWGFDLDAQM